MPRQPRQKSSPTAWLSLLLVLLSLPTSAGCPMLLASGVYLWEGGYFEEAQYEGLKQQRTVVFCRAPSSSGFSHAGASREIAQQVSRLLEQNVPKIKMVSQQEVDKWIDENDSDDYKALGRAVKADRVVYIELDHFDLYLGKTLYQGNSDLTISVYDMKDDARLLWERKMNEFLFPSTPNSGVPVQDRSEHVFQAQYIEILAESIAVHFYRHDPHFNFANDARTLR